MEISESRKRELQRIATSDVPWLRECHATMPNKKKKRGAPSREGLFEKNTFIHDKTIYL
jgi:hypothetical protein